MQKDKLDHPLKITGQPRSRSNGRYFAMAAIILTGCVSRDSTSKVQGKNGSDQNHGMEEYKGFALPNLSTVNQLPAGLTGLELQIPPAPQRENWMLSNPRTFYTVWNVKTTLSARSKTTSNPVSGIVKVPAAEFSAFASGSYDQEWPIEVKETLNVYIFAAKNSNLARPFLLTVDESGKVVWGIKPEDQVNVVAMCEKTNSFRANNNSPQVTTSFGGGFSAGVSGGVTPFTDLSADLTTETNSRTTENNFIMAQGSKNSDLIRPDLTKSPLALWKTCIDFYETDEMKALYENNRVVAKALAKMEMVIESDCKEDNDCSATPRKEWQVGKAKCEPVDPKIDPRFENTVPKVCRIRAQEGEHCTLFNPSNPNQRITSHELEGECDRGLNCNITNLPTFGWLGWFVDENDQYEIVTKAGEAICFKKQSM